MTASLGTSISYLLKHNDLSLRFISVILAASLFSGCQTNPNLNPKLNTQNEAGAVLLSVNTIAPWDEVKSVLGPNFKMDGDTAISKVAPITADVLEQSLQSTNFSLGLGLPQKSTSSTTTTTNTGTTTSITQSQQPGTAPIPPTGAPAGGQIPSGSLPSGAIGLDPMLAYKAANSLNQYVQLLNTSVNHVVGVSNDKYVPYVAQATLTFMPYRRDLPYDLHTLISFFASFEVPCPTRDKPNKTCASDLPINPRAIPFLVTDDVEKALKTRSSETARQIAIAIGALTNGVAANAGYNNLAQVLNTISSQDINSRLTVARESENTIYARLGAAYEATNKFALVGQTYDVFVLLLIPKFPKDAINRSVRVISNTEFRHAEDGTKLSPRSAELLLKDANAMMANILLLKKNLLVKWNYADDTTKLQFIGRVAGIIQQNGSYEDFVDVLGKESPFCSEASSNDCKYSIQVGRSFWTAFSRLLADSSFKSAIFELPKPKPYAIPKQTALIVDDKKSATVTLGNIEGDPTNCISASLLIKKLGQPERHLVAQGINTNTALGTLSLTFDSPAVLQMPIGEWTAQLEIIKRTEGNKIPVDVSPPSADETPLKAAASNDTNVKSQESKTRDPASEQRDYPYFCAHDSSINGSTADQHLFNTISAPEVQKSKDSGPMVDSFVERLVIQEKGTGSITIYFKLNDANRLKFTVNGAELLSVVDEAKKPIAVAKNGFVVSKDGGATLRLGNLINGTSVTIDFAAEKTGSKAGSSGQTSTLSFIVVSG